MSSGPKGSGARVSIPSNVKEIIENIKEITGQNHTDDEIYSMLKDCCMDPNETAQKLLLLDTFHEVRRKRDKRKENIKKEPVDSKWKSGTQGRANRGGRGSYQPRHTSHDAAGGSNLVASKEKANSLPEKSIKKAPLATTQELKKNGTSLITSSTTAVPNGPSAITSRSTNIIHENHASERAGVNQSTATGNVSISKLEENHHLKAPVDLITNPSAFGTEAMQQHKLPNEDKLTSILSGPPSGSYFSSSDPVLLPSQDVPHHGAVGPIQREVGMDRTPVKPITDDSTEKELPSSKNSAASEVERPKLQPNLAKDFHGIGNSQHLETLQSGSSTNGGSTISSRPSSNHNNRSQVIGSQKVGPSKEWKPKSTNSTTGHVRSTIDSSEFSLVSVGSHSESQPNPILAEKQDDASELQSKLEESHISVRQHVIIPNHLHVPEAEKLGFCFGSFDPSFGDPSHNGVLGSDKGPLFSQSSEAIHEPVEEQPLSKEYDSATVEDTETKYSDQPQSPLQEPSNVPSNEVKVSSAVPDYSEPNSGVAPGILQHPAGHASPSYNIGFMPPTQTGQPSPLDSSESQVRDAPRHPSFMVPQSFDPANYYAQYYRASQETDSRISPFISAGSANKFNGNGPVVSPHSSQSAQELQGGVPLLFSAASQSPMVTQAGGVMQSSLPTQQPFPLFRQPTGVPLTHFPPNYLPYGPYFSPLYIPSPAVHQFIGNGAFPQQPPAGNLYPTPTGPTAKYSSQYKQGSNAGNSLPGQYGLSMANYNPSSAATAVTSTSNEDLAAPQVKENNIYVNGQQTDGSGVWFTTPNRDISTLQAGSFYNLPQGQLAFNPPQPGHGTFTGMFHPPQAAAPPVHPLYQQTQAITSPADMVGPTASVYQQQQHPQLNWQSNY